MCVCVGVGGGRPGQTLSRFVCMATLGFDCSLTLFLPVSSAYNLSNLFGPRSGPTKFRS